MKSMILILFLGFAQITLAEDIDQQSLQLCEKIKSCALAELEGQEISTDMKAMVMTSMNGMCAVIAEEFSSTKVDAYEDLAQQAQACMTSLSSLSCSALMNGQTDTPACRELEKSVAAHK